MQNEKVPVQYGDYLDRVAQVVDATIARLAKTKFREDPIGGRKYSRATSIISSAYKRHNKILEVALLERLRDCPRLSVWREDDFQLSGLSLSMVRQHSALEKRFAIQLDYGSTDTTVPVDMFVYDKEDNSLTAYDIKRGNGQYDATKKRAILDELARVNMHLADYARQNGFEPETVATKIIFFYGVISAPIEISLSRETMDAHFRFPVVDAVEAVNEYFRFRLHQLIESED